MAVIARRGAEPLDLVELCPGRVAHHAAVGIGLGDRVVHQRQRGVAAAEDILRLHAQQLGKQLSAGGEPLEVAVVAHVNAVALIVAVGRKQIHHLARHVELGLAGLAAGHVQRKALCFERVIFRLNCRKLFSELLPGHFRVLFHMPSLSFPRGASGRVFYRFSSERRAALLYNHTIAAGVHQYDFGSFL